MKKIGFIGTGVMGSSMVKNLLKAGYEVHVYNRTQEKAAVLTEFGAILHGDISTLAISCDVIMTMVGFPSDVSEIYFSEDGIIKNAKKNAILIDFTTSTPTLAVDIYNKAKEAGLATLDAPVTGGDIGARDAKLAILIGGDENSFNEVYPILKCLGNNIIYHGKAGSGQHVKMCNQITIASNMVGVCEALAYAKFAGLDQEKVLQSISTGAAGSWSLTNLAPKMLKGDYQPGFYIKHFLKDVGIAINESEKMGLETPGLSLAKQLYEDFASQGEENSGTQALYKKYVNKL
ncbi:MAG: 6-phosphogluconate dehydrogenase NAD-binding [Bacillales bacterium]|nr:6-phosphogluconate dehydrogenase NAD-binding [Bacillales bacterium]